MAKKLVKRVKLQIPGAKATPAAPLGPALGQAGINIGEFVTKFNAETKDMAGDVLPVVIYVYEDRTYSFEVKTPSASSLIMKASGLTKASVRPGTSRAGKISKDDVKKIAERKMQNLNAKNIEGAMKIIEGSARSMGIEVK